MIQKIIPKIRQNWLFIVIMAILIGMSIVFCILSSQYQTKRAIDVYGNQLDTLGELKSTQITLWRHERIVDGQTIQTDNSFSKNIETVAQKPGSLEVLSEYQERMRTMLLDPNYSSIFLVDAAGNTILHVGDQDEKPDQIMHEQINETIITHEINLTDLILTEDNKVRMEMIVPIFLPEAADEPAKAFLVLYINPYPILYPLIQSFPASYRTIETLLVHKEADKVVFLNELRFRSDSALKLQIPLDQKDVPAVMAVNGTVGFVKGNDYRGQVVIASIFPIEGSDWKLIAKMDWNEINQPIKRQFWTLIVISVSSILVLGFAVFSYWTRKTAQITRGLSDSEEKRKDLEEKYSTLFNQANDAIILVEEDGKIIEVNDQAVKMYGYSREEFLSLSIADLREKSTRPQIPHDMDLVKNGSSNMFETTHRKKNGELFVVDVSSRYLSIDGNGFFQSLIRDVTEKKRAEEEIRRSEVELKKAQKISRVGSWHWERSTGKVKWSDEMFEIFNLPKDAEGYSTQDELFKSILNSEEVKQLVENAEKNALANKSYSFETRIVRNDGEERDVWIEAGEIDFDNEHNISSISGIVQDTTDKKAAARELQKSENLLNKIYDLLPVGLWITDKYGKLIRSNKQINEIWGKDILVGIDEFDVFHGRRLPSRVEIKPDDWASVHTIREGVTVRDEMIEIDSYDGKTKTILNYSTPIFDEKNEIEGSIIINLDITDLKQAEEQLSSQLDELRRWNLATLGRENRIRELKMEINELLVKQGLEPKYSSVKSETHE